MGKLNELKLSAEEEKKFQETKLALEKEIHKRFVKELVLRSQRQTTTQEQQAYLEQLYFDLKFINPDLAFATLKASALITARAHELQQQHQYSNKEESKTLKEDNDQRKENNNNQEISKRKHSSNKTSTQKPPVSASKSKSKSGSNKPN